MRDLSLAKLHSTAWAWNPQWISKLVNKVDCRLSYDSFLALCSRRCAGLPCYEILRSGILNIPLPYGMRLKVSPKGCHIFERLSSPTAQKHRGRDAPKLGPITQCPFLVFFRVLGCIKKSFLGTAFACGFLVERGRMSQYFNETGLLRNALLVNQKKSGSCSL